MPKLERELTSPEQIAAETPPPSKPCVMVIFGGTGDLAGRQLFPALYNLVKGKLLSEDFAIVGIGRNDYNNDQYRQIMGDKLEEFATSTVGPQMRDWLLK